MRELEDLRLPQQSTHHPKHPPSRKRRQPEREAPKKKTKAEAAAAKEWQGRGSYEAAGARDGLKDSTLSRAQGSGMKGGAIQLLPPAMDRVATSAAEQDSASVPAIDDLEVGALTFGAEAGYRYTSLLWLTAKSEEELESGEVVREEYLSYKEHFTPLRAAWPWFIFYIVLFVTRRVRLEGLSSPAGEYRADAGTSLRPPAACAERGINSSCCPGSRARAQGAQSSAAQPSLPASWSSSLRGQSHVL